MKVTKNDVLELLYESIKELNEMLPATAQLAPKAETSLLSDSGGLDSLGMVNLVSSIEDKVQQRYGRSISLNNPADVFSDENDPWRNVGTLAEFVTDRINALAA